MAVVGGVGSADDRRRRMVSLPRGAARERLRARFEQYVDRSGGPDACHPWTGAVVQANGYGRFRVAVGYVEYAHTVALALTGRPRPAGKQTDHRCHNADESCPGGPSCPHRRCCNDRHLRYATPKANARAGRAGWYRKALSAARTHCSQGHALTPENTSVVRGRRYCRICRRRQRMASTPQKAARGPLRLVVRRAGGWDELACSHRLPTIRADRASRRCAECDAAAA